MLTPEKVFADTLLTHFQQYISGRDLVDQEARHRERPPRVQRISVPGDHAGKNLTALHVHAKDLFVMEGSVIGYLQGHNIFGSCDVPHLVFESFKAAHVKKCANFAADEKRLIEQGKHLELKRIDIGVNLLVPEGLTRSRLLTELAHELIDQGVHTSSYGLGETVYRNQHSQASSHKWYDKGKQLIETHALPKNLAYAEELMAFAESVIRSEVVLRYPKLKTAELTRPQDCSFERLKAELEFAFGRLSLRRSVRMGLTSLDLNDIKYMYRTTYRCWENGDDLRTLLEPKAYERQVAYFATNLHFDITSSPPRSTSDCIPLGDVFSLSNAVTPPSLPSTILPDDGPQDD